MVDMRKNGERNEAGRYLDLPIYLETEVARVEYLDSMDGHAGEATELDRMNKKQLVEYVNARNPLLNPEEYNREALRSLAWHLDHVRMICG